MYQTLRSIRSRACRFGTQLAALAFMSYAGPLAQAQPAEAPSASATPKASVTEPARVLQADEVLQRATDDERFLRRVRTQAAALGTDATLAQSLREIDARIEARLAIAHEDQLRQLPALRLESLARQWTFESRRLARWQARMRQQFAPVQADALEVTRRRVLWQATQAELVRHRAPQVLATRAAQVLAELDEAQAQLEELLAARVAFDRRSAAVAVRIADGQSEVDGAIAEFDRRLLRVDVPPLWSNEPAVDDGGLTAVRGGLEAELHFARDYSEGARLNRIASAAVQLLLLALLAWLVVQRRRIAPAADRSPSATMAAHVLRRPVSAWLLLGTMASLALEPDGPLLATQAALLVALVPVLRLLPPRRAPTLRRLAFVVAALYVAERLSILLMGSADVYRLFQLALTVAALVAALWTLWRLRSRIEPPHAPAVPGEGLPVQPLAWAAALLLTVAAVANVVGNVSLAEMLGGAVIDTAYVGLLLEAGVVVTLALLQLLLAHPALARRARVRRFGAGFTQHAARWLRLAAFLGWAVYGMHAFRVLRPLAATGSAVASLRVTLGEISISVGDVLVFALSMLLAWWAARLTRRLLREHLQQAPNLPRGLGHSAASLSYYAVLLLGLLVALSAAGFKLGQFALVFGALGVGVGLGLQSVVNNFVSGLVLMFERPIQPGDVVEVGGVSGRVRSIGLRATTLRTFEGADIVVPNGTLASSNLTNWTLHDRERRVDVEVRVPFGSVPRDVIALLEAAARGTPGVAEAPAPSALFSGSADSALLFVVRAWTREFDQWAALRSELHTSVLKALTEAGIAIPLPQYDVNVRRAPRSGDASAA